MEWVDVRIETNKTMCMEFLIKKENKYVQIYPSPDRMK